MKKIEIRPIKIEEYSKYISDDITAIFLAETFKISIDEFKDMLNKALDTSNEMILWLATTGGSASNFLKKFIYNAYTDNQEKYPVDIISIRNLDDTRIMWLYFLVDLLSMYNPVGNICGIKTLNLIANRLLEEDCLIN